MGAHAVGRSGQNEGLEQGTKHQDTFAERLPEATHTPVRSAKGPSGSRSPLKLKCNTKVYSRGEPPSPYPYQNCACEFYGFSGAKEDLPSLEAAKPCSRHGYCCKSCRPECYGEPPLEDENAGLQETSLHLLETLHPIPQNDISSVFHRRSKVQQQEQDELSWRLHCDALSRLSRNPYKDCICDVVGLDEDFRILEDPRLHTSYVHRVDCVDTVEALQEGVHSQSWVVNDPVKRLSLVHQFRKTARSKKGRKKYSMKALRELKEHLGVRWLECDIASKLTEACKLHGDRKYHQEDDYVPEGSVQSRPSPPKYFKSVTITPTKVTSRLSISPLKDQVLTSSADAGNRLSKRRAAQGRRSENSKRPRINIDQEDWPTSYDPQSIATDILRAAGMHPTLPPLNPHLKDATMSEKIGRKKQQRQRRQTVDVPTSKLYKSMEFVGLSSESDW